MKIHKLSAYGLGAFVLTLGATLAFGQARVPFTRPPYLTTSGPVSGQTFNSSTASGNQAFTCTNTGCRLSLGNTARYLVDDGTNLEFIAPLQATTFEATTASGSSLTGGGASGPLLLTSNTPDSVTSGTVPAIRLQASQNITDSDLLLTVEDSAGNRRVAISELGNATFAGNVTSGSGVVTNFFNQSGYGSRGNNAITIPDDGAGTPAAYTWQPQFAASVTYFTCNDANGCEITMSLGSSFGGVYNRAFNVGTNTVTFKDTAGLSEMAGDFAMGQWDTIEFMVVSGRFVELNRSNN